MMHEEYYDDLEFFKDKYIPSSSEEDNPHLLSDFSDDSDILEKPIHEIIKTVEKEQPELLETIRNERNHMRFEVSVAQKPISQKKKESERHISESEELLKAIPEKKATIESKSPKRSRATAHKSKIVSNPRISLIRRSELLKALLRDASVEAVDHKRIDSFSLLGLKKVYSIKEIIAPTKKGMPTREKEIFHIVPITLSTELQKELKCESGKDILLDQPWGIISKSDVLKVLKTRGKASPLVKYEEKLKVYPEEEFLIGRTDEADPNEFLLAVSIEGRTLLLEELRNIHQAYVDSIIRLDDFPARPWACLGSDAEIDETIVKNNRPFISYDCAVKRDSGNLRFKKGFDYKEFYTEFKESKPNNFIEALTQDKPVQASPSLTDVSVQTRPEIPFNSTTQFSTEMRVEENKTILQSMMIDDEILNEKVHTLFLKLEPHLLYNEYFDLYKDDYELLAHAGEKPDSQTNLGYEYICTLFSFIGNKGKGISALSWHPSIPGVLAVSYSTHNIAMIGDLEGESDEEKEEDEPSDDEEFYSKIQTKGLFDEVLEKLWISQSSEFDDHLTEEPDKSFYNLSTSSLQFLKYSRDMRLFQIIQARKQFLETPEFEDLTNVEEFKYPLFKSSKKKEKEEIDIENAMNLEPTFLKRDYLFSDSFDWKLKGFEHLKPRNMMLKNKEEIPKKYVRDFLFKEFWGGEWNFGEDLEEKAIDINRNYREAGIMAFGPPVIPRDKLFLPGFKRKESTEQSNMKAIKQNGETDFILDDEECPIFKENKLPIKTIQVMFPEKRKHAKEIEDFKEKSKVPLPTFPHIKEALDFNIPWGYTKETKEFLENEMKDIQTCESKVLLKNEIEVMSDASQEYFERDEDIDDLTTLGLQHFVLIWSMDEILKPMHRLSCPFEVTCVSFCPYDGKFLAGGTSTGQVVVWEISDWSRKGIEDIKIPEPEEEEGFIHLRKVFSWFRRLKKIKAIPVSCLSTKKTSHSDRVVDIWWLPPNFQVVPGKPSVYHEIEPEKGNSMQFMSTSADGTVAYWDMRCEVIPPFRPPFSIHCLQRQENFPPPPSLASDPPEFAHLYLRWNPVMKVNLFIQHPTSMANRYYVTCVSINDAKYNYELKAKESINSNPDLSDKNWDPNFVYSIGSINSENIKAEMLIGTVFGSIVLVSWHQDGDDTRKVEPEGLNATVIRTYGYVHDGPVTKISRHPKNENLFLSAGGHVFSLWTINRVEPLKWRKHPTLITTYVGWTGFKASTFRVGYSDGTYELWDLLESGNEPRMSQSVAVGSICDLTIPTLPEPKGIIGIADQKGLLKFFKVPEKHQIEDKEKDALFFGKILKEIKRKDLRSAAANSQRKSLHLDDSPLETDGLKEDKEEVKDVKDCKAFKEEMYKWYLRRRGRTASWLDPAEKKWYEKEEENMVQTILKNKKISMSSLEKALIPLKEKERHEKELAVKKEEIIQMADEIFRKAVQELQITREEVTKSQVELEVENYNSGSIEEALAKVEKFFGPAYEKEEEQLEKWVKSQGEPEKLSFGELLNRNQKVRDFWNDRRRYLDKDQRWLREVIKEEMEKRGLEFTYWVDHSESYKLKKYQRRLENLDQLKQFYGDDYDPYWDLDENNTSFKVKYKDACSKIKDIIEKLLDTLQEIDPGIKVNKNKSLKLTGVELGEINLELIRKMVKYYINFLQEGGMQLSSSRHKKFLCLIKGAMSTEDKKIVQIKIPKGSFYRKFMKDKEWRKPEKADEIFKSELFKFKYGDDYPEYQEEIIEAEEEIEEEEIEQIGLGQSDIEDEAEEEQEKEPIDEEPDQRESKDVRETRREERTERREERKVPVREPSIKFEEESKGEEDEEEEIELKQEEFDEDEEDSLDENERLIDVKTLYDIVQEKKARGEEIPNIDELSSYESIDEIDSISSLAESPDTSLQLEEESQAPELDLHDELEVKEYFEGPPPRYEPPRRKQYVRAPHEEEETEEWLEEEQGEGSTRAAN